MALAAGTKLGPYAILSQLGAGGMGEVYRAHDTRLGRDVAIKVCAERFSERFEREARSIAALNHPNICTLYDVGANYLVMELVEGETLAAQLKRGRLSLDQTIQYGAQIAGALTAAHAKNIIHRDLKPANVMITKDGVKVLDFGLARSVQDETITLPNAVMGTPAYMAPEQHQGGACGARTDVHALGLVVSEMATGKRVPPGGRPQLDSLPERLTHVIERCIESNPEHRWQTARDVKSELEWAAKPVATAVSGENFHAPAATPPTRTVRLWIAAGALAILALAGVALLHFREPKPEPRVLRSTILPPEKTTLAFAANSGPMALSPDGRRMVFAATGEDGKSQLWIRSMDATTAQPLPGTEGAAFPFWSPDSRWVAFFSTGKLQKIDAQGGPPIALTAASNGQGGSWSKSGMIVFAPHSEPDNVLLKIPAAGGRATPATAVNASVGTAHRMPWFLPDGEHFLFEARRNTGVSRANLLVGSLRSTASKLIGQADSNAAYAEGRLLYLRGSTLMAQAFDVDALRPAGEAMPIAEHVEHSSGVPWTGIFSLSATGLLAYQTGAEEGGKQLTWYDRTGKPLGTIGEPRTFFHIELSPDRKRLVASVIDPSLNSDLWTYDLASGLATRFTSDPAAEFYAVWSPDRQTIVFNSARSGHLDLYRKPADSSGPEELVYADDREKILTSWSPDGNFVLYYIIGGSQRNNLWVLPLSLEPAAAPKPYPWRQTDFNEGMGQFSPDGGWVAYASNESERSEIYVAPFSRPTERHRISPNGGTRPRWRQDGREIFYTSPSGQLMAAEVRMRADMVEVGAVHALFGTFSTSGGYSYDISLDAQRILAAAPTGIQKPAEPISLVENWTATLKK